MKAACLALAALGTFAVAAQVQAQTMSATEFGVSEGPAVQVCDGCATGKSSGIPVFMKEDDVPADFGPLDPQLTPAERARRRALQNMRLFGRQQVAEYDGRLGALTAAHQYANTPYLGLTDIADPFQGGMAGANSNLAGYTGRRFDNTIKYQTPSLHGLSAAALYSFGEAQFSNEINRAYGATVGYGDGPVNLSVAYQRKNSIIGAASMVPVDDSSARNTLVAANVDFGIAKAYLGYGHNKGLDRSVWDVDNPYGALAQTNPSTDSRDMLLGVSIPHGAYTLLASYIHKDDRSLLNQDANQVALGVTYAVSRHTGFYAAYAKIFNKNGGNYTIGNETDRGRGNSAVNVGVRHSF